MPYNLESKTDKTVIFAGFKEITYLFGEKGGNSSTLLGSTDQIISLNGTKKIDILLVPSDKNVSLLGTKSIGELLGTKNGTPILMGATNKAVPMFGDEPDGFWHILISATFITIDNNIIKIDRN